METLKMQEVVITGDDGTMVRGHWWTHDEAVTVRSSHGEKKTTHIGGSSPLALARLMLLEMEEDRGHRVPPEEEEITPQVWLERRWADRGLDPHQEWLELRQAKWSSADKTKR
jgi:hypothetical protein